MAGRPSKKKPSEIGARLARLRKEAGLSQAKLAEALGIPQRTLSYYEREAEHLPSTMLVDAAKALGVSVDELLGVGSGGAKRGPKSKLEQQLDAVKGLPRSEQQFVSRFLENVIEKAHA
jgi:transcriptional regulator with XRE-family HTH domain